MPDRHDTIDLAGLAKGLTKARHEAVLSAEWHDEQGAWWPEGWYVRADKRVRYALCRAALLRDYLSPSQRLTPLGLALRNFLKEQEHG